MKAKSKKYVFDYPLYDEITDENDNITAVYLRVSTDTQAQEGYGLDVQYGAIKRYIEAFEIKNVFLFVDDGYTGMNEVRPAFEKMSELMDKGRVKLVVTYSLDRIGRTQMIILRFLKEKCEKTKCDFYAVKDNVDSRSRQTYGILISILSIFAEFDHDAIISKLTSGRIQRAKEGFWKGGGVPPYGYKYSKKDGELVVVEEEAEKVKRVFDMYVSSAVSPKKIADVLGLSSDKIVFNILRNRIYLGEIYYRGEYYKGRQQAIVDKPTFDVAQEYLKLRSVKRSRSKYLLSSILECGYCGAKMRYMSWGKGEGKRLKILCYSYFPDSTKKYMVKDRNCPNRIFDAYEAEKTVVESVMKFAVDYGDERYEKKVSFDEISEGLLKRKNKLLAEYSRLIVAYKKIGDEKLLNDAAETMKKIKKTERDIEDENEKKAILQRASKRVEEIRTLPSMWKKMDDMTKQRVIRKLVEKVVLFKDEIKVYLNQSSYEFESDDD